MSKRCKICRDDRREEVEKALWDRRSISEVSRRFGFSRALVTTHRSHMARKVDVEIPTDPSADEIGRMKAEVQRIINDTDDEKVRIAALRELRGYLELEIRVQQEQGASSSLTADPAFQKLAAALANTICAECRANIDVLTSDALSVAALTAHSSQAPEPTPGGVPAPEPEGGGGRSPQSD